MNTDSEVLKQAEEALECSDLGLARTLLKPLIERDVPAAIRLNASFFEEGISEEEMDRIYVSGISRAAELGDRKARYIQGVWYDVGEHGFEVDKKKASLIFKELADEGDLHCLWIYAVDLLWGRGAFVADPEKGIAKLKQAIDQGSSEACTTLARLYNNGEFGLGPDINERDKYRVMARELAGDDYVYDPYE